MKNFLTSIFVKFISVDSVCLLFAKLIAKLLQYASQKGDEKWDKAKDILKKTSIWIQLFNEVYDDDDMTEEEEQLVADAIKNQTNIEKLVELLKKN